MNSNAAHEGARLEAFQAELRLEMAEESVEEAERLGIAQGAADHLLETFNDDGSLRSAQGLCVEAMTLVRVTFAAEDGAQALELAQGAVEHLLETFNDDGSLVKIHYELGTARTLAAETAARHIVRATLDVEVAAADVDIDMVARALNGRLSEFLDVRPLFEDGELVVSNQEVKTRVLGPAAGNLDEEEVATFLSSLIESGNIRLEDLPRVMARYALSDPLEMREEFAERMGLVDEDQNDGRPVMRLTG